MAKTRTPKDEQEKAAQEAMQKRVEGLFSGHEEPPADLSLRQVEALKARIAELEAAGPRRPARVAAAAAPAPAPAPVAKPTTSAFEDPGEFERRKRNALWIAILGLIAAVGIASLALYLASGYAGWQLFVLSMVIWAAAVAAWDSVISIRRDLVDRGAWQMLIAAPVTFLVASLLIADISLMLGLSSVILVAFIAALTLPVRRIERGVVLGLVLGSITVLTDVAGLDFRAPASAELLRVLPLVLGGIVLALGAVLLREFRRFRFSTRLTAVILLTTAPLLVFTAVFVTGRANTLVESNANRELVTKNASFKSTVSAWLDSNISTVQELALLPDIMSMDPLRQKPVLVGTSRVRPDLFLVHTLNLAGDNVTRNDGAAPINYSDRAWFQDAKAGKPFSMQVVISKTIGLPVLAVAAPIRGPGSKVIGVVAIISRLDQISREVSANKVGQSGYSFVVDGTNQVVAHPDPKMTSGDALVDLSAYPPVAALRGGTRGLSSFTDENGVVWRVYVDALDNGWGVIVQEPEAEVLAGVKVFQQVATVALTFTVALIVLITWFSIGRALRPIGTLTETATAIAGGELDRTVAVTSQDEIGALGTAFNYMTAQVRNLIGTLEQRVAERTHDLELASEVSSAISGKTADLYELLKEAVDLIGERFDLYYTQIYLMDPAGRNLMLRAGTGDVAAALLERGHRLAVGPGSLNGRAAAEQRAVMVTDTQQNPDFLPNPLLPDTRSELAVPLIAAGQVVGVLDMQSQQAGALSMANLPAFEALAGQLAIAIQNAALFAEAREARSQVEEQVRRLTVEGWHDFLNAVERSDKLGFALKQDEVVQLEAPALSSNANQSASTPITVTGARIGAIEVGDEPDRTWTTEETELVQATAGYLAQHIENLRLVAQAESYRAEAEQALRRLTREGWDDLQARSESASGYVYDRNEVKALRGPAPRTAQPGLRHPLVVRDETIGELSVAFEAGADGAVEIISAVARQLSSHLENLRLSEQTEKRAYEMETVAEMSATTATVLDPDLLLQAVVDRTKQQFGLYHVHIYLTDDARQNLSLAAGAGEVGRKLVAEGHAIPMDAPVSLVARAARGREAIIVNDVLGDTGFLRNPLLPETRSEMAVPMIVGDQVLGVFDVQSNRASGFGKEDANIYTTLASQVAVALQNARLYVEQSATVAQLRELDRLKSSFLANMSHELRTPLNSILGFADVMLEQLDGPLTENMNTDLQLIQKNGQHLLHLINDVLDMAKIEAGKMNLSPERFKIHEILDEVVSITSPLASEKALSLFIEPDSDQEVQVFADRTRLRQVMINLVNNALKFTEKGKISVRADRQDDNILVSVRDTGVGIPPDKLEAVFQEFTQVDTSTTRKAGGTGLGLPISRRLIDMHGGHMWAESTGVAGQGSVFYVELPIEARITEPIERHER